MALKIIIFVSALFLSLAGYFWGFAVGAHKVNTGIKKDSYDLGFKAGYEAGQAKGYERGVAYQEVQFEILRKEMTLRLATKDKISASLQRKLKLAEELLEGVNHDGTRKNQEPNTEPSDKDWKAEINAVYGLGRQHEVEGD